MKWATNVIYRFGSDSGSKMIRKLTLIPFSVKKSFIFDFHSIQLRKITQICPTLDLFWLKFVRFKSLSIGSLKHGSHLSFRTNSNINTSFALEFTILCNENHLLLLLPVMEDLPFIENVYMHFHTSRSGRWKHKNIWKRFLLYVMCVFKF